MSLYYNNDDDITLRIWKVRTNEIDKQLCKFKRNSGRAIWHFFL